jgi:predicted transcriptional regulator
MPRSKLELYEDILQALASKPLTVDAIAYACNMDCVVLHQRLNFLMKNEIVEERAYKKGTVHALTRRGLAIYKTLTITKRLKKLQTSIRMIDEALQALPALSEYSEEKEKRKKRNENY